MWHIVCGQCVAVCCSVLRCVAVCCGVLQWLFLQHAHQVKYSALQGVLGTLSKNVAHGVWTVLWPSSLVNVSQFCDPFPIEGAGGQVRDIIYLSRRAVCVTWLVFHTCDMTFPSYVTRFSSRCPLEGAEWEVYLSTYGGDCTGYFGHLALQHYTWILAVVQVCVCLYVCVVFMWEFCFCA